MSYDAANKPIDPPPPLPRPIGPPKPSRPSTKSQIIPQSTQTPEPAPNSVQAKRNLAATRANDAVNNTTFTNPPNVNHISPQTPSKDLSFTATELQNNDMPLPGPGQTTSKTATSKPTPPARPPRQNPKQNIEAGNIKVSASIRESEIAQHPQVKVPAKRPPSWHQRFTAFCQNVVAIFSKRPLVLSGSGGELPKAILSPKNLKEATDNSYKEVRDFSHQIKRDLEKRPFLYLKEKGQVSEYRFDMEKIPPSSTTKEAVAEAIIPDEIKAHVKENSSLIAYISMAVENTETLEWLMTFPWVVDEEKAAEMKDNFFITSPSDITMTVCLEGDLVFLDKAESYPIRDMDNKITGTIDIVRRYNLNAPDQSPTYQLKVSN